MIFKREVKHNAGGGGSVREVQERASVLFEGTFVLLLWLGDNIKDKLMK